MWVRCNKDQYGQAFALVKERDNGDKGDRIRDGKKWINPKNMLHVKPIGFVDGLKRKEQ